ncbi:flagellar filament outer layer protein [Spirochaetia bacterium]|nr:flagellar filament outer layer protein [Spirochaetia bacterium]
MKRMFILVAVLLVAGSLFAKEAILIDFSKLAVDIYVGDDEQEQQDPNQNRQTMMDFGNVRGANTLPDTQKGLMKTSLAIGNWDVTLASSSRTIGNQVLSKTKQVKSKQWESVMGIRVHFPVEPHHSWAMIKPPFDIPAFEPQATIGDDGSIEVTEGSNGITGPSRFEAPDDGNGKPDSTQPAYGVVKNVGTIKSVAANVYGLNFPHSLSAILVDSQGNEKTVFLGYLNFDGWAELRWDNPAYVSEVRNRELRLYPLYPTSTPFVKFGGFLVKRDAAKEGGDFIAYFKDVKIIYDEAVLDTERDIEDESEWNIIRDRETDKKIFEMERFGQNQVLHYLDKQKQATQSEFTPTPTGGSN